MRRRARNLNRVVFPMTGSERRAAAGLAGIFALRMLGLFLILPVFAVHARELPGATPLLTVNVETPVGAGVRQTVRRSASCQPFQGRVTQRPWGWNGTAAGW